LSKGWNLKIVDLDELRAALQFRIALRSLNLVAVGPVDKLNKNQIQLEKDLRQSY
jgi:hypothetical protein